MRIPRPRGVTKGQIVLATILGVFGGVYIWKPIILEKYPPKNVEAKASAAKAS